jgi:hypothetical protein
VILSSCQRLGVVPSPEWQDTLAGAFLATIDSKDKAGQVRSDFFVKPLVGLAGMGWKPNQQQWQVRVKAGGGTWGVWVEQYVFSKLPFDLVRLPCDQSC